MKKKGGILLNRAEVDASSVNKDKRTFDVVFATETPVFRYGWEENFNEVLAISKENIRSARLDGGGMPLINNHNSYEGVMAQMGRIASYSIDTKKKEARATIEFSAREDFAGIFADIEAGIIRNISVGYRVWKYERSKKDPSDKKEVATYRAVDWEPMEISLVSVPADVNSSIRTNAGGVEYRAAEGCEVEIVNFFNNSKRMWTKEEIAGLFAEARGAGVDDAFVYDLISRSAGENALTLEAARAEIAAKKPATPAAPAEPAKGGASTAEQERERAENIRLLVRRQKLEETFADDLVKRGVSLDDARREILEKLAATDKGPASGGSGGNASARGDEKVATRIAQIEGLMERAMPGSVAEFYAITAKKPMKDDIAYKHDKDKNIKRTGMCDQAGEFIHTRMVDFAKLALEANNVATRSMSPGELATRAIDTTDLPDLFTSTVKRFLRMYYEPIVPEWMGFSRQVPADDFRVKTGVKFDAAVTFEELSEEGEYKESNLMSDEKATLQLKTYARMFGISRHTIINDDLGVLTDIPRAIGIGARQFQSKKIWGLVTGNVNCPDGNALFSAAHKNYGTGSSAAAIADASLSAGRTAMRRQKSPQGNELLITPKFLLVPPELETTAQKFLRLIYPTTTQAVNLWDSLEPFVNVYFSNAQNWYLVAEPKTTTVDGMVHAYLTGQEGLYTESYIDKKTDKMVIKARLDFDCGFWGWQGWYKNDGVALGTGG